MTDSRVWTWPLYRYKERERTVEKTASAKINTLLQQEASWYNKQHSVLFDKLYSRILYWLSQSIYFYKDAHKIDLIVHLMIFVVH